MIVYFDIEKVNETVKIDIQRPSEGKQHAKKIPVTKEYRIHIHKCLYHTNLILLN